MNKEPYRRVSDVYEIGKSNKATKKSNQIKLYVCKKMREKGLDSTRFKIRIVSDSLVFINFNKKLEEYYLNLLNENGSFEIYPADDKYGDNVYVVENLLRNSQRIGKEVDRIALDYDGLNYFSDIKIDDKDLQADYFAYMVEYENKLLNVIDIINKVLLELKTEIVNDKSNNFSHMVFEDSNGLRDIYDLINMLISEHIKTKISSIDGSIKNKTNDDLSFSEWFIERKLQIFSRDIDNSLKFHNIVPSKPLNISKNLDKNTGDYLEYVLGGCYYELMKDSTNKFNFETSLYEYYSLNIEDFLRNTVKENFDIWFSKNYGSNVFDWIEKLRSRIENNINSNLDTVRINVDCDGIFNDTDLIKINKISESSIIFRACSHYLIATYTKAN